MTARRLALVLALPLAGFLPGCGLFGGGDDEVEAPAELVEFRETLNVRKRWSVKVGDSAEDMRLGLAPVSDAVRVYAASRDGQVHGLGLDDGRKLWTTRLKVSLAAGPGVGDGRVVVAGSDGEVIALAAADGSELWRTRVAAEILAAPAVGGERVVLRSADGRLLALNGETGAEEWVIEQSVPRLTLRGTGAPVIAANVVICGFDNGRLLAVDLLSGTVVWDQALAAPSGRSDLERLVDIDGAVAAVSRDLYVTGYRGQVASIALESGQALWARDLSSVVGPGVDWLHVYVATDSGDLVAMSRTTGVEQWRNGDLERRGLTRPVAFGESVVVGDFEGYLHWFDARTGTAQARERVADGRISGAPSAQGELFLAQSESGVVAAFEIRN